MMLNLFGFRPLAGVNYNICEWICQVTGEA